MRNRADRSAAASPRGIESVAVANTLKTIPIIMVSKVSEIISSRRVNPRSEGTNRWWWHGTGIDQSSGSPKFGSTRMVPSR